ncbi:MAG: Maf family nucleotide pyrophosphatase [bacterium]|nr:Maf family nucleotide pyrophosphatase [bacterium]
MNLTHPLILASNSPRRQQILKDAGFVFEVFTKNVDEEFSPDMDVRKVAEYLATKKNKAYLGEINNKIILTADTTVVLGKTILNKPEDDQDAIKMLKDLSGTRHEVITGVAISLNDQLVSFSDTTFVDFKELVDEEIEFYVTQYKPLDKAGAYGIQEWIGMIGVTKLEGSFYNVVGLPIDKVYQQLIKFQSS